MEKHESEDEDSGVYQAKSLINCDSPSNLSVTRTKSRSRSRSHSRSRSNSSSSELEVDSPPPPRITISPLTDIQHVMKSVNEINQSLTFAPSLQTKKSEAFSVSALLRDDQPKTSKSPASSNNSFENIRFVLDYSILVTTWKSLKFIQIDWLSFDFNQFSVTNRPSYPQIYEQNVLSRPLFHPFPLFAMLQQGQQQQNTALSGWVVRNCGSSRVAFHFPFQLAIIPHRPRTF